MTSPKPSPDAAAAMVPLKVILAGGLGMTFDDACAKIFQEFDPPIVCGTYSSVSTARQDANRELGADSPFRNQQSEHMVANSAFQGDRGVNASNIPGASGYSEGSAFSYNAYDDQSAGTEHKFLTDAARNYEKNLTSNPTVADRLAASEKWTKDSLLRDDIQRTQGGPKRSRVKDKPGRTQEEKEQLAEAAAKCLAAKAKQQFEKQGVKMDTPTRRGLAPPKRPDVAGTGVGGDV